MISLISKTTPCASSNKSLSETASVKLEDAAQFETEPEVISKITRKQTVRKFYRSQAGNKVYICYLDSCARQFNHLSSLIKHERIHRNERPYVCGICGQSFIQSSNLKRHENSHTGEKPYKCELCPKQFSTACNLRQHTQIHENCEGELNYSCQRCGKSYIYTSSLLKHQKKCALSAPANELPKAESEEVDLRKIVKTEEKIEFIEPFTSIQKQEHVETTLTAEHMENSLAAKNKIIADLSNAVRTNKAESTFVSSCSVQTLPQFSVPQYSNYHPNFCPSLNLMSRSLQSTGSTASRLGFGFNSLPPMFPLQNISSMPPFSLEVPSDHLLQVAMEHRLLQQNLKLRNSIQNCLLRNGHF